MVVEVEVEVDVEVEVEVEVAPKGVPGVGTTSRRVRPCLCTGLVGPERPFTVRLDSTTISSNVGANAAETEVRKTTNKSGERL